MYYFCLPTGRLLETRQVGAIVTIFVILQSSDVLMTYPGHLLEGYVTSRQRGSRRILQPQPTGLYIYIY